MPKKKRSRLTRRKKSKKETDSNKSNMSILSHLEDSEDKLHSQIISKPLTEKPEQIDPTINEDVSTSKIRNHDVFSNDILTMLPILNEKTKCDDHKRMKKRLKNCRIVHTREIGVQTNDNCDLDEIIHFFRNHVLNFPFTCNGQNFVISNISLCFKLIESPSKPPVVVQIGERNIIATCKKFLQKINHVMWQKSEKPVKDLRYTYKHGWYETSTQNNICSTDTKCKNLGDEGANTEFTNTIIEKNVPKESNQITDRIDMAPSLNQSELNQTDRNGINVSNSTKIIVSNVEILNQIVIKDTKHQKGSKNGPQLKSDLHNDMIVKNNYLAPNSNNLPMLKDYTSTTADNQIDISSKPYIKVINIDNLKNKESDTMHLDTTTTSTKHSKCKVNDEKLISCDTNRKRKSDNDHFSSKSVNKRGKYNAMIEELEKILELSLEQPSEDNADIPSTDDSYSLDYSLNAYKINENLNENLNLVQKEYKSTDQINKIRKVVKTKPISKKQKTAETTGKVKNHLISKHENHSRPDSTKCTLSGTKLMKAVGNLSRDELKSELKTLKVKNDSLKIVQEKKLKNNEKSVMTELKHSNNELVKQIVDMDGINVNLDELKLKNSCKDVFECEECGSTFLNMSQLKEHLHKLDDCFLCEKCRVIFVASDLNKHKLRCKLPHRSSTITVEHFSYLHSCDSKRYCKLCMETFDSFRNFTKHVYLKHRKEGHNTILKMKNKVLRKYLRNRLKSNVYKCRFCGYLSANMKEKNNHHEICLKEILEKCSVETQEGTFIEVEVIM